MKKHLFVVLICTAASMGCTNPGVAGSLGDVDLIKPQVTMQSQNAQCCPPTRAFPEVTTERDGFIPHSARAIAVRKASFGVAIEMGRVAMAN